jgi:transcriptional regulator with XRE-family HTH domain
MSQLDLASAADVSQRHISFLETGRSKPSREMVLHLGRTLDVPLREQNVLLTAAGYAPAHSETALERLGEIRTAISTMLDGHEPNMAIVLDRRWNVVASNAATTRFMAWAFAEPPGWIEPPPNLMRLVFHPEGLRTRMRAWEETASAMLRRLERDVAIHPSDGDLARLFVEIRAYPGVADLGPRTGPADADDLLLTTTYVVDGLPVSLFTTIAVIGDAHDLTLSELRIETFWPADRDSAERWEARFGSSSGDGVAG